MYGIIKYSLLGTRCFTYTSIYTSIYILLHCSQILKNAFYILWYKPCCNRNFANQKLFHTFITYYLVDFCWHLFLKHKFAKCTVRVFQEWSWMSIAFSLTQEYWEPRRPQAACLGPLPPPHRPWGLGEWIQKPPPPPPVNTVYYTVFISHLLK